MTAKMNRQGQVVLRTTSREKLDLRSGDALVVVLHAPNGRIVLEKRRASPTSKRSSLRYLNPRPLPAAVLERVYRQPAPGWDKVEAEAVALARRALVGTQPEEL